MHFDPEAADSSGVIDPFVRLKFGKGCEWRDTATHYRALNGEAFFNWRFTFSAPRRIRSGLLLARSMTRSWSVLICCPRKTSLLSHSMKAGNEGWSSAYPHYSPNNACTMGFWRSLRARGVHRAAGDRAPTQNH